jgi:transposase
MELVIIPNNPSWALKYPLDKHLYAQRHLVECCFSKLKQFRRVATRFEITARNYHAVVTCGNDPMDSAPRPITCQ